MKTKYFLFTLALLVLLAMATSASAATSQTLSQSPEGGLMFVENIGQFDPQVRFQAQAANGTLWVADDGLWVSLIEPAGEGAESVRGVALKLSFEGANPQAVEPFALLETRFNYFLGDDPDRWYVDVPVWGGVRYVDLYPGIDLELSGQDGQLAPKLVVRNAAALSQVLLRVEGGDALSVLDGHMVVETALGPVGLPLLAVDGWTQETLQPQIRQAEDGVYEFAAPFADGGLKAAAEPALTPNDSASLVTTLIFSTYLGGIGDDWPTAVVADGLLNTYVCGGTMSANFPALPGGFDTTHGGYVDVFVTKYSPAGQLLATTFMGGGGYDSCGGMRWAGGVLYVTGQAWSGFPVTAGVWDTTHNGGWDVFVAKLNTTLNNLLASTFFGGFSADRGLDIAVDSNGNVYVSGDTFSGNFPVTAGTAQTIYGGGGDGFVFKLNTGLTVRHWATYLGGSGKEEATGLAVKGTSTYVTGATFSSNYPTQSGYDLDFNGGQHDGFVTKLDAGGKLVYSTYIGGAQNEWFNGIAVDSSDRAHVSGVTSSANYPTTANAYQNTRKGAEDAVITVLNAAGNALVYSSYFGGSDRDSGGKIALDAGGYDYIIGTTHSTDLPTRDAYQTNKKGGSDAFLIKLQTVWGGGAQSLLYGTYLGGSAHEVGGTIAFEEPNRVLLAGTTRSNDFPLSNAADNSYNGGRDVFVTKLVLDAYYDGDDNKLKLGNWYFKATTPGVGGGIANGSLTIDVNTGPARACWHQDLAVNDLKGKAIRYEAEMRKSALMNSAKGFVNPYISLQVQRDDGAWQYNFGGIGNATATPGGPWVGKRIDVVLPNDMKALRASFCVWDATPGLAQARSLLLRLAVAPPPPAPPPLGQNLLSPSWTWAPGTPAITGVKEAAALAINVAAAGARGCWIQDLPGAALRGTIVRYEASMAKTGVLDRITPTLFVNPYISLQAQTTDGIWHYNHGGVIYSRAVSGGPYVTESRDIALPADLMTLRAAFCVWQAQPGVGRAKDFFLRTVHPLAAQGEDMSFPTWMEYMPDTPSALPEDVAGLELPEMPVAGGMLYLPLLHR